MKKLFTALLIFSCVFYTQMAMAQVSAYSFAQTVGTYKQVGLGGTLAAANSGTYDDGAFSPVTLPWTVTYHGATFTTIGISPNGYAAFGATAAGGYTPTFSQANVLSPFGADLYGNTSTALASAECAYATTGDAGNRVFTIQWLNWGFYSGGANEVSFQIKIYESNNSIQFVYNNGTAAGAPTSTPSNVANVGLTGATTSDFNLRTSTTSWTATTAAGTNAGNATSEVAMTSSIRPTNGLTFTWTAAATVAAMTFSQSTTTFVPIQAAVSSTNLTASGSSYDDSNFGLQTIPFTFTYHGAAYTTVGIQQNGFAQLGSTAAAGYTAPASYGDVLSPLNCDAYSAAAQSALGRNVSVNVIGTTPNRIYVIQWSQWGFYSGGLNEVSYQIRLSESTNTVQFVYGPAPGTNAPTSTPANMAYVGLTGATSADFNLRTSSTSWASTTTAAANSSGSATTEVAMTAAIRPVSGLTFTWSPPACSSPTALAAGSITTTSASMSFTPGSGGTNYIIEYGPSATFTTPGTAATAGTGGTVVSGTSSPIAITGLSAGTQYRVFIRKNCGSGNYSANSTALLFSTLCNALNTPWSENFESISTGTNILPTCWSFTNNSGTNGSYSPTYYGGAAHGGTHTIGGSWSFDVWDFTPGFNLVGGQTYSYSYWVATADATAGYAITSAVGSSASVAGMTTTLGTINPATAGQVWTQVTYTYTPATSGVYYFGQHNSCPTSAPNGIAFDDFSLTGPCSGTPTAGTASGSLVTAGCAPRSTTLTLQNGAGLGSSGITYQWQSSTVSGGPYTDIPGATGTTYAATANATTYYVVKTTCANGGGNILSNQDTLSVTPTPGTPTVTPSSASINQGQTVTFTASDPIATSYAWFTAPTGGSSISTSAAYTTPSLCSPATYYVQGVNGTCVSPTRASASVLMNSNFLAFASNTLICGSGSSNLSSSVLSPAPAGGYTWSTGATGTGPITVSPTTSTQYTVSADFTTCTATASVNVGVIAASAASIPTATPASQCHTGTETVSLNANVSSSGFTYSSIPYVATVVPGSGVTTLASGGSVVVPQTTNTYFTFAPNTDDGGWANIPLGFSFNFFGTNFTTANVGTNGVLNFGNYANFNPAQYSFPSGFPSTSSPLNTIAAMAVDLNLTSGSLSYWVTGISPTRAFHLFFQSVPGYASNGVHTSEVILYETTGIVDIVVGGGTSTSAKTVGLQGSTGLPGNGAAPRNAVTTAIGTEAWRFNPPANYTFTWSANGGNPATATLTPNTHVVNPTISNITTPGTYVYNVAVTNPNTSCTNTSHDTFVIIPTPSAPTTLGDSTKCGPASVTFTVTSAYGADSVRWWTAATGGTLLSTSTSSTWTTPTITADTAYYAEIWNGTCPSPRTRTVAHYANILGSTLTVNRTPANGVICSTGSVDLTASLSGATSYNWSPATGLNSTSGQTVTASPTASTTYTVVADFGVCTVSAQGNVSYIASGTVFTPSATPAVQCYSPADVVQLNANISASAFSVVSTPYVATVVPGSGVTTLASGGTAVTPLTGGTLDDGGWGSVPIGFNYDFFGNTFSTINVGTNGTLQFGAFNGSFSGGIYQYAFTTGPAFPNTANPGNTIAAMAVDMNHLSGSLSYWTDGTAPTRVFHVFYNNVPGFSSNGLQTVEVKLYETTGIVDVVVGGATSTSGKIIGLQDSTKTIGSIAPGRDGFTGAIGTEAWRFTPPSTNSFSWVANGSNPSGATISSTTIVNPVVTGFTTPGTYIYNVTATNTTTGCSAAHNDTFVINRTPATPTTTGGTTTCGAYPVTFTSTGSPDSVQWYSAATGGTLVGTGSPWTTPVITGDTAYYATVTTGLCASPRVRTTATYTVPPSVSISGSNDLLCAGGSTSDVLSATGADPAYNYTWSPAGGTTSGTHGQTYTVLPTTTTTYSVTGTNSGTGCRTVATHVVQVNALPAPPTVSVSPNNVCPGSTVTLTSNAVSTGYSVAPVPFAPVSPVGSPTSIALGDETVSSTIPIGFTFNYFGTNYTNLQIGSNGFVDFNTANLSAKCCSGGVLPTAGQDPMIAFAWTDLDQSVGGTEDYFNLTSPNRFVVRFNGVFHYSGTQQVTTELILYQTGQIEIHTTSINAQGTVSAGVTNGTLGTAIPGANASTTYAATNAAYRFAPANPVTYLWTPNGSAGYMAAGQETLSTATANPTSNTGRFVYTSTITDAVTTCSNSAKDTVLFSATPNSNITGPSSLCQGVSGTYNVVFSGAGPWSYTIDTVGGTISGTTSSNTVVFTVRPSSSETIRVTSLTDNSTGCSGVFSDLDTQRIVTTANCAITWLGGADTSWHNPNNWNPVLIPNSCSVDVTIPSGTPNQPVISQRDIQVGSITVGNNQRIKLNGHNLSACKNFSGPSSAATAYNVTGSGKLIFNGSVAQTYNGYGTVDELVINNTTGGVTMANASYAHISVYRGIHLQSGNLANSNSGAVILLSNSADTAAWLNNFSAGYTGTFTGKLTAQRKVATTGTTWQHQMSSPVSGSGVNFYSLGQSTYGWHAAAPLIPSSNCSEDSISWTSPYSTALSWHESNVNTAPTTCATKGWYTVGGPDQWGIGTGYSVYLTSASKPSLTGTPNTGNINVTGLTNSNWTVTSPEGHVFNSGWSLVGNPYPSSMDMSTSPLSNGFDNQIQIFTPTGPYKGTYTPAILGGRAVTISSFQAFMVHKTTAGGTSTWQFLQSERSMGEGAGYSFLKTGEANQLAVNVAGNGFNDMTMVQFRDAATDAFDPEFDANKFASMHGQPTLYTLASGSNQWMGINVLSSFERSAIVPMGFEAGTDGSYTFTVSADDIATFDPSVTIYLEDKQNPNSWINLRNNNSYTFTSMATDNKERFALHFEKTNTAINEVASSNSNLNIFAVENKVLVDFTKLKEVNATIQIYNILGQELSNETHHASSTYVKAIDNVEAAYVIVKVKMSDGTVTGSKLFLTK